MTTAASASALILIFVVGCASSRLGKSLNVAVSEENKSLGGHVPHGGRSDLEASRQIDKTASDQAPVTVTVYPNATIEGVVPCNVQTGEGCTDWTPTIKRTPVWLTALAAGLHVTDTWLNCRTLLSDPEISRKQARAACGTIAGLKTVYFVPVLIHRDRFSTWLSIAGSGTGIGVSVTLR